MAVCERNAASAAVVGSRKIDPATAAGARRVIEEVTIIDRVRMFVNEDPKIGWRLNRTQFEPLAVARVEFVSASLPCSIGLFGVGAEKCVHRKASGSRRPARASLRGAQIDVRRAFINVDALG